MGYEITAGRLFGGGGAAFEELVAKRAIGAEPLAGRSREDAGPSTVRAGLFGVDVGTRLGQLHQGQRLDRLGGGSGAAAGGVSSGGGAAGAVSASSRCPNSRVSQRSTRGYGRTCARRSQIRRAIRLSRAAPVPAGARPAMRGDHRSRSGASVPRLPRSRAL